MGYVVISKKNYSLDSSAASGVASETGASVLSAAGAYVFAVSSVTGAVDSTPG